MKHDIHKLGVWLQKVCQEGIADEHKIHELKLAAKKKQAPVTQAKAS